MTDLMKLIGSKDSEGKEIVIALLSTVGGTESNDYYQNFRYLCDITGYSKYPMTQDLPVDMDIPFRDLDDFMYNKLLKGETEASGEGNREKGGN